jgi:hypothetical protein
MLLRKNSLATTLGGQLGDVAVGRRHLSAIVGAAGIRNPPLGPARRQAKPSGLAHHVVEDMAQRSSDGLEDLRYIRDVPHRANEAERANVGVG